MTLQNRDILAKYPDIKPRKHYQIVKKDHYIWTDDGSQLAENGAQQGQRRCLVFSSHRRLKDKAMLILHKINYSLQKTIKGCFDESFTIKQDKITLFDNCPNVIQQAYWHL